MFPWSSRKNVATNAVRNRLSKTVQTVRATPNANASPAVLAGFFRPCAKARSSGKPLFGLPKNAPRPGASASATRLPSTGLKKASSLPHIVTTLLPAKKTDVLELDELWSFVYPKAQKRWVWIALCRRTRQVVSFFIGDRSAQTCRKSWELIPKKYRRCRTFSDFWEAYSTVIQTGKHQSVGKESGETCHVKRWNNTLRQRICRFVRKTLSFSKSDEMHQLYLHLFVYNYSLSLKN